jgi:hypothetical protein
MEQLMPLKANGTYAHWGTQPPVQDSGTSPSSTPCVLPSSSTQFNIPSGYNLGSPKHNTSSLDISASQSFASKGKKQVMGVETLQDLQDSFESFSRTIRILTTQPSAPPLPPSHSSTSISHVAVAAEQFLKNIERSKERDDVWLSDDEILQMLELLENDELMCEIYIQIAEFGNEGMMRGWVKRQLARKQD